MTQRKEHSWNKWIYENRRTPVWVMMLTSVSCCRHVQQDSACSFSVRQDSDIYTHIYIKISSLLDDVMSSTREDVIRRRYVLLRCADSSLNHEWSKTASFVSCLDACLDVVGVRSPLRFPRWLNNRRFHAVNFIIAELWEQFLQKLKLQILDSLPCTF
jgi:hypothetical protein